MALTVIFQNKPLVQSGHVLIGECRHLVLTFICCLEHSIQYEIADIHQKLVVPIVTLIMQSAPRYSGRLQKINAIKKHEDFLQCDLPVSPNTIVPYQIMKRRLQDLIKEIILRQLIKFTGQLLFALDAIPNRLLHIQLSTHNG